MLAPSKGSGQDIVCILYSITTCKDLSNCGKEQEASKLAEKRRGLAWSTCSVQLAFIKQYNVQLCRRSEQMI